VVAGARGRARGRPGAVDANLTLQESNEELRNSQELLTDQNERLRVQDQSKSDLLANVSHDLRTPLVSIRGYSEMLMRGDLGPVTEQQRRGLATSLRNLDKLLGLVENLLDFERLRHGDAALTLEDLDLLQLSGDIVELFRPRAQERGVALSLRGAASAARELWVSGDRIKLHQVASNLVSNALKFTVEGGAVWVELRVASREEAGQVERQLEAAREASSRGPTTLEGARRGRWVMLRVADTGCGISREHLSRIFDRHYSAHPGQNQGLGLGLSIIDQIVHSHGGMIEVSSAEGEGSVFTVWLPIGHPEAAEAGAGRFLSGPLRATAPSGAILLVEDDPDALEMTRLLLEGEGFEVEAARGEREMLEALARSAPGLVLLDYTLEGSATGHELLARLKQEPGTRQVPVVMLTGRTDAAVRDACIAAGAAGFLPKPFGVQELLEVVRDHLGVRVGSPRG
jgi:signal transduction histidine kinase/CheY-like chemotaxis protein